MSGRWFRPPKHNGRAEGRALPGRQRKKRLPIGVHLLANGRKAGGTGISILVLVAIGISILLLQFLSFYPYLLVLSFFLISFFLWHLSKNNRKAAIIIGVLFLIIYMLIFYNGVWLPYKNIKEKSKNHNKRNVMGWTLMLCHAQDKISVGTKTH